MFKAPLLILSGLVSIGLVYTWGAWVLLAMFGLTLATLLGSTGDDPYDDCADMETEHCGLMTDFGAR